MQFILANMLDNNKEHLLTQSKSPDGTNGVTLYEIGRPFIFGSSKIRIYASGTVFDAEIKNDGAALTDNNYKVEWDGNTPVITLSGEEQSDFVYKVAEGEKEATK